MAPDKDRYEHGLAILRQVAAAEEPQVLQDLAGVAPDLGRYLVEFAYGDVYARPGLSLPPPGSPGPPAVGIPRRRQPAPSARRAAPVTGILGAGKSLRVRLRARVPAGRASPDCSGSG